MHELEVKRVYLETTSYKEEREPHKTNYYQHKTSFLLIILCKEK